MEKFNKALIGRDKNSVVSVVFRDGDTIRYVLSKADITLALGEAVINNGGYIVKLDDEAKDNQVYYVTEIKMKLDQLGKMIA